MPKKRVAAYGIKMTTKYRESVPLIVFYTNADSLKNKMQALRSCAANFWSDVLAFVETWDRSEIEDA